MDVTERRQDGVSILRLQGRLDSNNSDGFEKTLLGRVEAGESRFILDFEELDS